MPNSKRIISNWLNSGEYLVDISEMRTNIMRQAASSNSEATTASIFERELYYTIRLRTNITLEIKKEQAVNEVKHTFGSLALRTSGSGRLDAVVNNLIIEYKHHSKLQSQQEIESAFNQTVDYLEALKGAEGEEYSAILTDGLHIAYFSFTGKTVSHTDLSVLANSDIDMIVRALLVQNTKRFVPENILKDFFISATAPSLSKSLAFALYHQLKENKTEKTEMLYEEWKVLMHLSCDDNGKGNDIGKRRNDLSLIFADTIDNPDDEYCALFALQTTYAIIIKLIACKVIDKIEYNGAARNYFDLTSISSTDMQQFFEKMEDGYSYRSSNIVNFLEGDFFSWYSDREQWNTEFWKVIITVIKCIDQYSAFSFNVRYEPIDIFKDLYMSIIPRSIRHSMGEYFTPKWLADYVVTEGLKQIENRHGWKAVDPCCGSGIFLISLIKKIVGTRNILSMTADEKDTLRKNIIGRVYGIDINPLSVLSARVGYYLALQPFGELHDTEIPVYLGDSAIIPTEVVVDNIPCYKYSIVNLKCPFDVVLPKRYVKKSDFGIRMAELQTCVKTDNSDILYNAILSGLTDEEKRSNILIDMIKALSKNLVMLHQNKWDGIWIRISTNFMLIARMSQFDLIVGNPPWVKWEHLPAAYANKIKELCDIKHIFSGANQYGGTQLNICALISNVTASNWLSKTGVLAFLMPDSIMSQNSYEGFRNFYTDFEKGTRLFLQRIDRWMPPLRPFRCDDKPVTQDFNTYYFSSKPVDYHKGIPVRCITRKKEVKDSVLNRCTSFADASEYLLFNNILAAQLGKTTAFSYLSRNYDYSRIIGPTEYLYRTGVEFTPQEIYMLVGIGRSGLENHYRFSNRKFRAAKYIVDDMPDNGWDLPVEHIYPIITGPHISPFKYDTSNEFCILPYTKECTEKPISHTTLMQTNRELLIYLSSHSTLISQQSEKSKDMHRGDEFYALSKIGPYTFADNIVAARDNSKFCASVINSTTTPWGVVKQTICVKHTIIISQDKTGNFITYDEAHFINGILNSKIVISYIMNTFKSNGFSLNKSGLYFPKYDSNNPKHKTISDLSKLASDSSCNDITEIQESLSELYLKVCDER